MPGALTIQPGVVVPEQELSWRFSRSSGPGGQSVNTTDSRVELSFDLANTTCLTEVLRRRATDRLGSRLVDGVLTITASEHRSQLRNRGAAEQRLAQTLREAMGPPAPARRPTRPTRSSVRRRLDSKRQRSLVKRQREKPQD